MNQMRRKRRDKVVKKKDVINSISGSEKAIHFFVVFVVGFIPLLVYCKIQTFFMPTIDPPLYLLTGGVTDHFTYYKSLALLLAAICILGLFGARIFTGKLALRKTPVEIPLLVFALSLCISMSVSAYKTFAIWGGESRNLGVVAYLSCAVIFFVLINIEIPVQWENRISRALFLPAIVNAVMLCVAFYGINLWDYNSIKLLLSGEASRYITDSSRIYGTLNHPNYLSGFGAILFAVFAGKAVFASGRILFDAARIFYIFGAVLAGVMVFTSKALSGVVTMAFVISLLLGLVLESRRKKGLLSFVGVVLFTAVTWSMLCLRDASFLQEFAADAGLLIASAVCGLLFFGLYLLARTGGNLNKKKVVQVGGAVLALCLVAGFFIAPKAMDKVTAEMKRTDPDLIMQRLKEDPFDFPEAKFGWGTGRIYIWQETLKLVAMKPLFGYGFDTLSFEFNQTDPSKIAGLEIQDTIVDKPHNVYINMLYGAGGVAFLAYMVIIIMVLWKALQALRKDTEYSILIWPLLLGILAYLYQGLFNDPVQGVEPIFWVLMGLVYTLAAKSQPAEKLELRHQVSKKAMLPK